MKQKELQRLQTSVFCHENARCYKRVRLGLADYRIGVPPQWEETLYKHEVNWTDPKVIRDYVAAYFVTSNRFVMNIT